MERHWWKECMVYQVYPRSFKDSNGDGVGDLRGIIEKLDYLKWLGIGAVWLNPIYDSPNDDMGYDIRDYEEIMSEFGTMDDFEALLEGLHQRDIKLIMDLVVNHSSDEHKWFVESRKSKDSPYRDYYIWRKGNNGEEPNNWSSFFTPSAWKRDEITGEYYLHLFSEKQPDLNWENSALRQDVYAMVNRWLDKGVDGFRMDVINLIAKAPGLPDASGIPNEEGFVFADAHFANQPRLHDHMKEMRRRCFEGRDCICVGETPFVTPEIARQLTEPQNGELDMIFPFELMDIDSGQSGKWEAIPFDIMRFKEIIDRWQCAPLEGWNSLFWGNHDQPRMVSRFGCCDTEELRVRSAKMLATALYLLRGTPFIYQGEEIGMTNVPFGDVSDLRDIESVNYLVQAKLHGREKPAWDGILQKGRDNARTPMQWDNTANSGFSTGVPWMMVNPNYSTINVDAAMRDADSILHYYKKLIELRCASQTLIYGTYLQVLREHSQIFAYTRALGNESVLVLCNMSEQPAEFVMLDGFIENSILLSNRNDKLLQRTLVPFEARVMYGVSSGC